MMLGRPDGGTKQAWIAVEFPQPTRIGMVGIHEALAPRVRKFEFQYRNGADWQTLFSGTELGANFKRSFDTVTAVVCKNAVTRLGQEKKFDSWMLLKICAPRR